MIEIKKHRKIVEAGGGIYICSGSISNLILFNSPATGSTLALEPENLTVAAVRAEIVKSDETFKPNKPSNALKTKTLS